MSILPILRSTALPRQLARGEDRARGDGKLVAARAALELAARGDLVGLQASALGANGLAIRLRPAEPLERLVSLVLAVLVDVLEGERAGR